MKNITIGNQYNNFTVIQMLEKKAANGQNIYLCQCLCGARREVRKSSIGIIKGCGCIRSIYKTRSISKRRPSKASQAMRSVMKPRLTDTPEQKAAKEKEAYQYRPSVYQQIEDIKIQREIDKQFSL